MPEAGPALLIVMTPVAALPINVPVKPGADAVTVATLPLSVGAAFGVTVVPFPAINVVEPKVPKVGAALAVTLTLKLPAVLSKPSLTLKPTALAPTVALHAATKFAVTVPVVLTIVLSVKPAGTVGAVTTKLPALCSRSLTVAMVLLLTPVPC